MIDSLYLDAQDATSNLYFPEPARSKIVDWLMESRIPATRVNFAMLGGASFISNALGSVGLVFAGLGVIVFPKNETLLGIGNESQYCPGRVLSDPYQCFLKVLNPKAEIGEYSKEIVSQPNLVGGAISDIFAKRVLIKAIELQNSGESWKSKITWGAFLCTAVVSRIFDAVIGVIAAVFSLLTLGHFKECNTLAYHGLQAPSVIADVVSALNGIVHA